MLSAIELVKHICSVAFERLHTVSLRKTAVNVNNFAHHVDDRVIKVQDDHHRITSSINLFEIFRGFYFVENGVIDASTRHERVELYAQQLQSVCSSDYAVIWALIVSKLLLLCQLLIEF